MGYFNTFFKLVFKVFEEEKILWLFVFKYCLNRLMDGGAGGEEKGEGEGERERGGG